MPEPCVIVRSLWKMGSRYGRAHRYVLARKKKKIPEPHLSPALPVRILKTKIASILFSECLQYKGLMYRNKP